MPTNISFSDVETIPDVATLLGISKGMIYYWIKRKVFVPIRFGSTQYVLKSDIQELRKLSKKK